MSLARSRCRLGFAMIGATTSLWGISAIASTASEESDGHIPEARVQTEAEPEMRIASSELLTLEDVVRSANETFPLLQAVSLEGNARALAELEARGAFDSLLRLDGDLRPEGFYENYTGAATVEQPTRLWGTRFFGGYRYGHGDFPSYDGARLTDSDGELRLGARIPLLRGGAIDPARAKLRRAALGVRSFAPELQLESLHIVRDATLAFWTWLGAGRSVEIAEELLEVAEARQTQIVRRVEMGLAAKLDIDDNQRLVVERQVQLRGAERDFIQSAIRLSLYLRDSDGNPVIAGRNMLPEAFPTEVAPSDFSIEEDLEFARSEHPLLTQFALEREKLAVEVRLARNETLPALDLSVEGSQDFGSSRAGIDEQGKLSTDPRSGTEVKALVRVELPVLRREARGRLGVAQIRVAQLERRMRYAVDQVVADALLAFEALEAAHEQTGQARENLRLAELLRDAEERRLELGLSNLIDVNIREVQAATAAQRLVNAQQAYFHALARYTAAIARPS